MCFNQILSIIFIYILFFRNEDPIRDCSLIDWENITSLSKWLFPWCMKPKCFSHFICLSSWKSENFRSSTTLSFHTWCLLDLEKRSLLSRVLDSLNCCCSSLNIPVFGFSFQTMLLSSPRLSLWPIKNFPVLPLICSNLSYFFRYSQYLWCRNYIVLRFNTNTNLNVGCVVDKISCGVLWSSLY